MSLVEFKVSKLEKDLDINNIDSKIKFLNGVANILAKIDNNIERDIYIDKIASKYKIGRGPIINEIDKKINKKDEVKIVNLSEVSKKINANVNVKKKIEQYIIALMICKDIKIQEKLAINISENTFKNKEIKMLYNYIISLSKEFDINKIDILSKTTDEILVKELTDVLYIDMSVIGKDKLLCDVLTYIKKDKLSSRRIEILTRLGEDISQDEKDILQFELNQILIELSKLK
ncbi:MAG: hypothetical protein RR144_04125 [Clostridia bacterium]